MIQWPDVNEIFIVSALIDSDPLFSGQGREGCRPLRSFTSGLPMAPGVWQAPAALPLGQGPASQQHIAGARAAVAHAGAGEGNDPLAPWP